LITGGVTMKNIRSILWGLFFVAAGVLLLINQTTDINIPVFQTLFGAFIILIGLSILFKKKKSPKVETNEAIFEDSFTSASNMDEKYSAVFGKQFIDASGITLESNKKIVFDVIFGEGTLILSPDIPTLIKGDAVFGNICLPDNSQVSFGTRTYEFSIVSRTEPYLLIDASAVFGKLNIKFKSDF
jgi:hypothetical protein